MIFLGLSIAAAFFHPARVLGTPPEGYKTSLLATGRFGASDFSNSFPYGLKAREIKRESDVYVQNNVWAPGGSSGWHSHPGHSLIIVTAGTVTNYEGHDPGCKPHVYKTGMGFVDPGGDHIHILRNEGRVEARTVAVQIVPANAVRRIEVADPGNCHF